MIFLSDVELKDLIICDTFIIYKDKRYKVLEGNSEGVYVSEVADEGNRGEHSTD